MKINYVWSVLCLFLAMMSCNKDDDTGGIPEADRTEQQAIDKDSLLAYLNTHYYNSSLFESPGNYSTSDIIVQELPKDENGNYLPLPDPDNNSLLIDDVETIFTNASDTDYELYVLRLNQGGGGKPDFTDNVLVNYSGNLPNGTVFDSTVNPVILDLLGVIPGWRNVLPTFDIAEGEPINNPDGTVSFNNYGFGMMFIPSGLAYFSQPPFGVPVYSNLIFKFELYNSSDNDHDNDLILSQFEDIDGNGNVFNDDTDNDGLPDFNDTDDDGDGTLTRFEDLDEDGDPRNDDTDGDGIPNYLDPDNNESNQSNN